MTSILVDIRIFLSSKTDTHLGLAASVTIAKSEQSSHTPGGSHHRRLRPYHFNFLERKNSTNKGTDKQYVVDSFINSRNFHK